MPGEPTRFSGTTRRIPPGPRFKKIDHTGNVYSVRVGLGYRALGRVDRDVIVWFWIGSHKEYDRLV